MIVRPRRLRQTPEIRRMVRETSLRVDDFIYPVFVVNGSRKREIIPSMPGIYRLSVDELLKETEELRSLGIPGVILFGLPDVKDSMGSAAYAEDGIVQRAISAVKENVPGLIVLTDVCLCQYTDHGHCGVIKDGRIDNDTTIDILSDVALSHARAGADFVAPSDMMDGRVGAIRNRLEKEGYTDTGIMSYAVKYSSAFYGPFREAADSAPQFGDRKTYQMDPANRREALKEAAIDVEEGADIVMVKPALPYLDIIYQRNDGDASVYKEGWGRYYPYIFCQRGCPIVERVKMKTILD